MDMPPFPKNPPLSLTRRQWLKGAYTSLAGLSLGHLLGCSDASQEKPQGGRSVLQKFHVVVIGGGFAGASCARALAHQGIRVTLVEPKSHYIACPLSNLVIAGLRDIQQQIFSFSALSQSGIRIIQQRANAIDTDKQQIQLQDGSPLGFDRLVLAPGIEIHWQGLAGYSQEAAQRMPHAWQAGTQTTLLRDQLHAMPNGGKVLMSIPDNPYRCPPGPYERASLIAHYLKQHKPRSKLVLLDAKDNFSKKPLFMQAWAQEYGDMIEWQGLSDGAQVIRVDAQTKTLFTDFDEHRADVANVIPPQRAGRIAQIAGATDASGWCPITPSTFESTLLPKVHVIGDAAIANAMPKSAFAANAQAKLCAVQVARLLTEQTPLDAPLINTCYSLIHPNYGISVADVFQPSGHLWQPVSGAGGTSPLSASAEQRRLEAAYALDWFNTLTQQTFGAENVDV